jgi:hypothetical protein
MSDVLRKLTSRTWPWTVAAVVVVSGFMYWLYAESSTIQSAVAVTDTTEALPYVPDTAFARDPTQYSLRRILMYPLTVREQIGRAALLVDLPGLESYPLVLERNIVESGLTFVPGDELVVAGQVYALNDSLLDVYAQRGLFEPENREKLTGQTTFFLVDSLDFYIPESIPEGETPMEGEAGPP